VNYRNETRLTRLPQYITCFSLLHFYHECSHTFNIFHSCNTANIIIFVVANYVDIYSSKRNAMLYTCYWILRPNTSSRKFLYPHPNHWISYNMLCHLWWIWYVLLCPFVSSDILVFPFHMNYESNILSFVNHLKLHHVLRCILEKIKINIQFYNEIIPNVSILVKYKVICINSNPILTTIVPLNITVINFISCTFFIMISVLVF
jgi:hypothetical protein